MYVFNRGLSFIEALIASSTLAVASVIVFTNVIMRYVFHDALPWAEEVVRYSLIWSSFIGASIAMRYGLHIGVEVVVDNLPPRPRRVMIIIGFFFVLLYCTLIAVYGADFIYEAYVRWSEGTGRVASTTKVPFFYIQASVPVGVALMGLRQLQVLIMFWRGDDHPFQRHEQPGGEDEHYHEALDHEGEVLQSDASATAPVEAPEDTGVLDDRLGEKPSDSSLFDDPSRKEEEE